MSPFKPKGDRSLRAILTEMVAGQEPGRLLTFEEMQAELEVGDRAQVRQAVAAARPGLLKHHQRALVAVRGTGYRVAYPRESVGIAQDHRDRAGRQVGKAMAVLTNTDENGMTGPERERHHAMLIVITSMQQRMNSAERDIALLQRAVLALQKPRDPAHQVIPGWVENPKELSPLEEWELSL